MSLLANANLYLIGPRCSGKTTLGRRLSRMLGAPLMDTDNLAAMLAGMSIAELVASRGWDEFRAVESQVLANVAGQTGQVVATGGGIVLSPANRAILARGVTVYLRADASVLVERMRRETLPGQRPALTELSPEEEMAKVLRERAPLYTEVAGKALDATKPLDELAELVVHFLRETGAGRNEK